MTDRVKAPKKAARVARWAVTLTKWNIRRVLARSKWELIAFRGPAGGESRGVVDLLAVRKDHGTPPRGMNRGDRLQIVLIQVKGGRSAWPTLNDKHRLLAAKRWHRAGEVLLARWIRRRPPVRFFHLRANPSGSRGDWVEVAELETVFH